MSCADVLDPVLRFVAFGGKEANHFVIAIRRHRSHLRRKTQDLAQAIDVLAVRRWFRFGCRLCSIGCRSVVPSIVLGKTHCSQPGGLFTKRLAFSLVLGDRVSALGSALQLAIFRLGANAFARLVSQIESSLIFSPLGNEHGSSRNRL